MVLLSESSSEISSLSSDSPEVAEEYEESPVPEEPVLPPTKRQKLRDGSRASSIIHAEPEHTEPEPDLDGDISSDTSGDVPNSPINAKLDDEEVQEQVTVCAWEGCRAGDMGNMDRLVEHIHNEHIENRQKKYTCEWIGCGRKGMTHASGYALKAHMRSHTREKPFYCYLPECDRAFTRSDALAKHMRTVHETEALRPSDPVPKSMQSQGGANKGSKLKIILKTPQSHATGQDDAEEEDGQSEDIDADALTPLTEQQGFTHRQLEMDLQKLFKVCAAEVKWATEEHDQLREECKELEEQCKQEWLEKEVLFDQMVQVEEDYFRRRKAVLAGEADIQVRDALKPSGELKSHGSGDEDGLKTTQIEAQASEAADDSMVD